MKHLKRFESLETWKKYKLSAEEGKDKITRADIEDIFAHSFDLCVKYSIDTAYFDPEDTRSWASNDFSNPDSPNHPEFCIDGFSIEFHHNFYDKEIELTDFKKYVSLVNEIDSDIDRMKALFKVNDIFFDEHSNDSITLIIVSHF